MKKKREYKGEEVIKNGKEEIITVLLERGEGVKISFTSIIYTPIRIRLAEKSRILRTKERMDGFLIVQS